MSPRVLALALLVACGDDPARVALVPISPCGQVENETALRVVAYTGALEQRRTVPPGDRVGTIDSFPGDTVQLGVEVVGDSGRVVAVGKTSIVDFDALSDGTNIPIVMAPLGGFCPVGAMTEPRRAPLVARAGDGILVVGGFGASGEPVATAELYDRATATFSAIEVPATLMDPDNGLAGAVLAELSDGRVALTGTASHAIALFDPKTRTFSMPSLFDHRAFHSAVAVDDKLLVIGGCAEVAGGTCSGTSLASGFLYSLADLSMRDRGPTLAPGAKRYGATVWPLGEQSDGKPRYLLAGGFGDPDGASRFALADADAETLALAGPYALLDGGGVLGDGAVLPPDRSVPVPHVVSLPVGTPSTVTLEDGSVLAVGSGAARFDPSTDGWTTGSTGTPLPALDTPTLAPLSDGTVLVLGGAATVDAWIYRPSLVGPTSGSVIVVPDASGDEVLTAADPSTVDRTSGRFVLTSADDDLHARALVGGPRMAAGTISAIVRPDSGGVALIAAQSGPGHALVGRLVPGEPARILSLGSGTQTTLCTGSAVDAGELASPVGLAVVAGVARLTIGTVGAQTVKATCGVPALAAGSWGIAAAGAGARLDVGPVTIERGR